MNRAVLLVSHGELANAMKESVELIIGNQPNVYALPMNEQATLSSYSVELEKVVKDLLRVYDELILLADIKGGTPCNASAFLLLKYEQIKLIAGFNLGLVIEACITPLSLMELVKNATNSIEIVNVTIRD
ncbi:PTS sugar transporter subunit IIA [Caldibacillus thermoamylovorans]